jgi:hypothetical protein
MIPMPERLLLASSMALLAPAAQAQRGFDWDYPDGLGVRYLLYDRIERRDFDAKDQPQELRALFLPKSKQDWVRFKGTELAWGMYVYEFPGDGAGFGEFLKERDPRRTFREFRVDGEPLDGDGSQRRYWEFVDTWRPLLEVVDRPKPRGPYRYAVVPELSLRLLADKTMDYVDPFVGTDGDNCYARLHPAPSQWLRIDGVPGPVGWMLKFYVFPELLREGSSSDRDDLVDSFATFVDGADPQGKHSDRAFATRDEAVEGAAIPCRLWRWTDTRRRPKEKTTPCFHGVAAVYQYDGREIVLLGIAPANAPDERADDELKALEKMVQSLEPWQGEAKAPGFAFYNVASSCRIGDREVGVMVHVPMGTEQKPDRELLKIAKRMIESVEADPGKR